MPDETDPTQLDLEMRKLDLERYKARLDYRKFVLASVFAAVAIAAIPPSFQLATAVLEYVKNQAQLRIDQQNKEAERLAKQEEFRESYIKEFLANALNQDIELRIRFADYFASVSAESFRQGWIKYHDELVGHRDEIRKQIDQMEAEWQQKMRARERDEPGVDRLVRNLSWAYKEVGYVERNRSVAADPRESGSAAVVCGVDRWPVKVGTDEDARKVATLPEATTIAQLALIAAPANPSTRRTSRFLPIELKTFQIKGVMKVIKKEADGDYHMVIADLANPRTTMIVEAPEPKCALGSPFLDNIEVVRVTLDQKFGEITRLLPNVPVTITGVAFFDIIHGQEGIAPNGIELHPVLSIDFS